MPDGGALEDPLPEDPGPKPMPLLFEPPTGVDVLPAGWPIVPVFPDWVRVSVSGS